MSIKVELAAGIETLGLSTRTLNALWGGEVRTVGDLIGFGVGEFSLLKLRNFGKRSLSEVKRILAKAGLRLGMDVALVRSDRRLRDYFAAKAMAGLLAAGRRHDLETGESSDLLVTGADGGDPAIEFDHVEFPDHIARLSYVMADAMMRARDPKEKSDE